MSGLGLRIGYHVSKSKGLIGNINALLADGGSAVQFFISPNQGWHAGIPLKETEVKTIREMQKKHGFYMVVHGKYILNFARPHSESTKQQRKALVTDLEQASRIGINVIIHQGKNIADLKFTREQAIDAFVDNIKAILDETSSLTNKIILENSCQQGTELGYTIEELAVIYDKFESKYQNRLKFCLDLCHVHVAGTMDVSKEGEVERVFKLFDELIGLEKLEVIHFNDSKVRFDGHNDHHEDIMIGFIGNPKINPEHSMGLQKVVEIAEMRGIPLILETPATIPYIDQIKLVQSWSKVKPNQGYQNEYIQKYEEQMNAFAVAHCNKKQVSIQSKIQTIAAPSEPALPVKKKVIIRKKVITN